MSNQKAGYFAKAMKSVDWLALLDSHPLFQSLDGQERKLLLSRSFSQERKFRKDAVILKEGEIGNSLFLIGSGAASIVLHGPHDETVNLYTLRDGELFGEMALIEHRPRSATVIATEPTTVLEIDGAKFLPLMQKHSEIGLYLLAKLSQRLRHIDDEITARRVKGLDETMNTLKNRVDAIAQTTDAKLLASQAMFDETNQRASEIIANAERARSRAAFVISTAAGLLALLGAIGLGSIWSLREDVADTKAKVETQAKEVQEAVDAAAGQVATIETQSAEIEQSAKTLQEQASQALRFRDQMERNRDSIVDTTSAIEDVYEDLALSRLISNINERFPERLQTESKQIVKMEDEFRTIIESKSDEKLDRLLKRLEAAIVDGYDIKEVIWGVLPRTSNNSPLQNRFKKISFEDRFEDGLDALSGPGSRPRHVIAVYYLILVSDIAQSKPDNFQRHIADLKDYVASNKVTRLFDVSWRKDAIPGAILVNEQSDKERQRKERMFDELFALLQDLSQNSN